MILLGKIWKNLREKGETPAYCCEGERISYRAAWAVDRQAVRLFEKEFSAGRSDSGLRA